MIADLTVILAFIFVSVLFILVHLALTYKHAFICPLQEIEEILRLLMFLTSYQRRLRKM